MSLQNSPPFFFQERTGGINWREVNRIDADRLVRDVDLRLLQSILNNITYSKLEEPDLQRFGDATYIKLFRLAQLSIEYLLYTQDYVDRLAKNLEMQYKAAYEEVGELLIVDAQTRAEGEGAAQGDSDAEEGAEGQAPHPHHL